MRKGLSPQSFYGATKEELRGLFVNLGVKIDDKGKPILPETVQGKRETNIRKSRAKSKERRTAQDVSRCPPTSSDNNSSGRTSASHPTHRHVLSAETPLSKPDATFKPQTPENV
jgi:hypothetical protein